uniref:Uncharacterized protein n=1 Tax=Glossina brevipalpis TaxID=37001 RepID=A0A1A9X269_9MUSC
MQPSRAYILVVSMSTQRGNACRTRSQKYKNRTVFKNDLHDKTPMQKRLNTLHVNEVCKHCKDVIEWKIKYKKYKPLSQPKTCAKCQQRNVRKAYHVLCKDCALESRVCAKCLKTAEEVEIESPQPSPEEQVKLKVEMDKLIKSFPERKRRAFLRYMEKGKKETDDSYSLQSIEGNEKIQTVPHSRDELLQKIEELKLGAINEDNDDEFVTDSDDDETFSNEY